VPLSSGERTYNPLACRPSPNSGVFEISPGFRQTSIYYVILTILLHGAHSTIASNDYIGIFEIDHRAQRAPTSDRAHRLSEKLSRRQHETSRRSHDRENITGG
jgi:hypothetical protein